MAKLGELFVDLGVNSGNALNSLTNFSLKFLALKTAAEQFGKVFDGLFGDVARFGQELVKINTTTGMSEQWLQRIKYRAEQTGTSLETVVQTIKNLQSENAKILMGEGNISPYQKLGIDMSKMRAPAELLDEIMAKVLRLQPAFQQAMLAEFGISEDILFMYQQKNIKINDSLLLTEKEVEDLNQMNKEWIALKQTVESGYNKTVAQSAESINGMIRTVREMLNTFIDLKNKTGGWGSALVAELDIFINYLKKLGEDSKFFKFFSGFVDNLKSIGSVLGEAVAHAVYYTGEGINAGVSAFKEWDRIEAGTVDASLVNPTQSLNNYTGGSVIYNDNSQTTINTSEGAREYERLNNQRIDKTKSEVGTIELLSRRG